MFACEWLECSERFGLLSELEWHVKSHLDVMEQQWAASVNGTLLNNSLHNFAAGNPLQEVKSNEHEGNRDSSHQQPRQKQKLLSPFRPDRGKINEDSKLSRRQSKNASSITTPRGKLPLGGRADGTKGVIEQPNITCSICHAAKETNGNVIVLCDGCVRAYHQQCHRPHVNPATINDSHAKWYCKRCTASPWLSASKNSRKE